MTTKKTYAEKLRDPRWQKKRLEIMSRDSFTCGLCESKSDTLNVHHRFYLKGVEPWDHPDSCLETLCKECHEKAHKAQDAANEWLARLRISDLVEIFHSKTRSNHKVAAEIGEKFIQYSFECLEDMLSSALSDIESMKKAGRNLK